MKNKNKLPSRFQIGDEVMYEGKVVKVIAVQFTESKVFYEISIGRRFFRKRLYNSLEISPVEKQESK